VISPILANIYLHELDAFVESLRQKYEQGDRRRTNPEYQRIQNQRHRLIETAGGTQTREFRDLTRQLRAIPSGDTQDSDYIRVRYLRYADDWIVGVIGPRWLAEQIKDDIRQFLQDELKLELSHEKTLLRAFGNNESRSAAGLILTS